MKKWSLLPIHSFHCLCSCYWKILLMLRYSSCKIFVKHIVSLKSVLSFFLWILPYLLNGIILNPEDESLRLGKSTFSLLVIFSQLKQYHFFIHAFMFMGANNDPFRKVSFQNCFFKNYQKVNFSPCIL